MCNVFHGQAVMTDNTNTNPPARPNKTFAFVSPLNILSIFLMPYIKNGRDTTVQTIAHFAGKKPSIICIP